VGLLLSSPCKRVLVSEPTETWSLASSLRVQSEHCEHRSKLGHLTRLVAP
jgi:hypothetical protein